MPKYSSTMKEPLARPARENPSVVTTGIMELRRMWRTRTSRSGNPLARAVRM